MDNENKLKAPRAVRGFRTPTMNFRTTEPSNDRSLNILISPQKKVSCLDFKSQFSKQHKELNSFEFEKEIINDFDELSVKSEIFSILRDGSTWCDSVDIRNSNPTAKLKDHFLEDCLVGEFEGKSSPLRIHNPIYKNFDDEFNSEGNNISEFPIYNTCKKLD